MENIIEHLKREIKLTRDQLKLMSCGNYEGQAELLAKIEGKILGLEIALTMAKLALEDNLEQVA
jgi:hypothetical protein